MKHKTIMKRKYYTTYANPFAFRCPVCHKYTTAQLENRQTKIFKCKYCSEKVEISYSQLKEV